MARGLKFWIYEVEGLYYLCSENKGADLHLCFYICKKQVFSYRRSNSVNKTVAIWKERGATMVTSVFTSAHANNCGSVNSSSFDKFKSTLQLFLGENLGFDLGRVEVSHHKVLIDYKNLSSL